MEPIELRTKVYGFCLIAAVAIGVLGFNLLGSRAAQFDPTMPGLGRDTTALGSSLFEGRVVSGYPSNAPVVAETARLFRQQGHQVALWLGASQVHAINDYASGDELAVVYANRAAAERGASVRYVQISDPNANLNEMLSAYLQLRQLGVRPDWIIVPLVYDDLREPSIRPGYLETLAPSLDALRSEGGPGIENLITERDRMSGEMPQRAPVDRSAVSGTPQEQLEDYLVAHLEGTWEAYRNRNKVSALIEVEGRAAFMRVLMSGDRPFRIDVPADMAQWNGRALDSIIQMARVDGYRVLMYLQPYRPGEELFHYDRQAYEAFAAATASRCARDGVTLVDLSNLVPAELYGLTSDGQPDVFHFRDGGHRLLGGAVDRQLESVGLR